jgi:caffeoyl-CoA O-methyltransferase
MEMSMSQSFLFPENLAAYYARVAVRERPLLARLRQETAALPMARMQIAAEEGQFLDLMLRLTGARRCIEIGVFTGYSSLVTALALPEDGYLLACDINPDTTAVARRYWAEAGVSSRIRLELAPALHTLEAELAAGAQGSYDFAFIDADKGGYIAYYECCMRLLRCGGLIAVDNTLWSGSVADPDDRSADTEAIRAFNEHVAADRRVDYCLVPISDGVTLVRKR